MMDFHIITITNDFLISVKLEISTLHQIFCASNLNIIELRVVYELVNRSLKIKNSCFLGHVHKKGKSVLATITLPESHYSRKLLQ